MNTVNKPTVKFIEEPFMNSGPKYPENLTKEIREDYKKLNIPIENETKGSI